MAELKPGVLETFEKEAAACERQVYFTCLHLMGRREDAEDCAQEAMLRAFRAFSSFKGNAKFSTWMHTIAVRVCMDALHKRRDSVSLDEMNDAGLDAPDDLAKSPYMALEQKERTRILHEALGNMPDGYRAAVALCDLERMPIEQAARAAGVPEGTMKSRLFRGRRLLQKLLLKNAELFVSKPCLIDEGRLKK